MASPLGFIQTGAGIFSDIAKAVVIGFILTFLLNMVLNFQSDIPGFTNQSFADFLELLTPFFSWVLGFATFIVDTQTMLLLMKIFTGIVFPVGLAFRIGFFIANTIKSI